MADGYEPEGGDFDCIQFDILLAEYVDGSMEPKVRDAFEEWMRIDPAVAERVDCLKGVREELCRLQCRCAAPVGFEERLRGQVALEMMRDSMSGMRDVTPHLRLATALATVVFALLACGVTYSMVTMWEEDSEMARIEARFGTQAELGSTIVGYGALEGPVKPRGQRRANGGFRAVGGWYTPYVEESSYPVWSQVSRLDSATLGALSSEAVAFP